MEVLTALYLVRDILEAFLRETRILQSLLLTEIEQCGWTSTSLAVHRNHQSARWPLNLSTG